MMEMNLRKRSQGDEEISEEESKQKREKHDWSIDFSNPAIISSDKLEEIKKIIKDVLTQYHSGLSKVFSTSLEKIATDMYSHGLISETVKDAPNFRDILKEFQLGMDFIHKYKRLVKHCELFLQSLVDQHGPPKQAAISVAEEWSDSIRRKLDITIEFNIIE